MSEEKKFKEFVIRLGLTEHNAQKLISGAIYMHSELEGLPLSLLENAEDAYLLGQCSLCLTESKRAIHCQVDEILSSLGYRWKSANLRDKLDILSDCGFAAHRLIKKVNKRRNIFEHEYKNPSLSETEEAMDIALLFVGACRYKFEMFEGEFSIGFRDKLIDGYNFENELTIGYDTTAKGFKVYLNSMRKAEIGAVVNECLGRAFINNSSGLFARLVKLSLAGDSDRRTAIAFHELFEYLRGF